MVKRIEIYQVFIYHLLCNFKKMIATELKEMLFTTLINFFNEQQLQGCLFNTCGHYCMLYSRIKSKKKTLDFLKENSRKATIH